MLEFIKNVYGECSKKLTSMNVQKCYDELDRQKIKKSVSYSISSHPSSYVFQEFYMARVFLKWPRLLHMNAWKSELNVVLIAQCWRFTG
jgi:hypothetical protein